MTMDAEAPARVRAELVRLGWDEAALAAGLGAAAAEVRGWLEGVRPVPGAALEWLARQKARPGRTPQAAAALAGRQARESDALRANLARRKQQSRARSDGLSEK